MTTIEFNGNQIELKPQENAHFLHLANNFIPLLSAGEPFAKVCALVLADGMRKSVGMEHPLMQSTFWMMHQVGVRSVTIDLESQQVNFGETTRSDMEGRPFEENFSPGNQATGRAMVATLMAVTQRSVRVNGEEWAVRVQPLETMKRVNQETMQSRQFGEEIHVTAVRRLIMLLMQGKTRDDAEVLAALQVVADLNVRGFRHSADGKQVAFEAFSEPNALAMAYLSNLSPDHRDRAVAKARELNARCMGKAPQAQAPLGRRRRD
ncbi:MAG: hypothetical protein EBQ99_02865 [Planctomycetes bacterium]|nr:hypothetical protein [Planctomycetota bacterium]